MRLENTVEGWCKTGGGGIGGGGGAAAAGTPVGG